MHDQDDGGVSGSSSSGMQHTAMHDLAALIDCLSLLP